MARARVIRDPVYGYVTVPAALADLVDHALVQRLRRVGQTSLTSTVYPAATGSRFEHALGAMHLARRGWEAAWRNGTDVARRLLKQRVNDELRSADATLERIDDDQAFCELVRDAIGGVGLLHDIGHPPFSHVLEPLFAKQLPAWMPDGAGTWAEKMHEEAGAILMEQATEALQPPTLRLLTRLIFRSDPHDLHSGVGVIHSVVAGEIDVDRIDYLMRDGQKAGTEFGAIDHERLVDGLSLWKPAALPEESDDEPNDRVRIAPLTHARSAVETVLVQRTQSYKWITFHHRVVAANLALHRAAELAMALALDNRQVTFAGQQATLEQLFSDIQPNLNYVRPTLRSIGQATRWEFSGQSSEAEAVLASELGLETQTAVDDAAILSWLQSAYVLAGVLLADSDLQSQSRSQLARLRAFVAVALKREKRVTPAWKSLEEYAEVADHLVENERLTERVEQACETALTQSTDPERQRRIARFRHATSDLSRADARVAAFNRLMKPFVNAEQTRRLLLSALEAHGFDQMRHFGFWEVTPTTFTALQDRGTLAALRREDRQRPILMRRTSPLVAALVEAEENRPQMQALFFQTGDRPPASVMLRRAFSRGVSRFIDEQLEDYLSGL